MTISEGLNHMSLNTSNDGASSAEGQHHYQGLGESGLADPDQDPYAKATASQPQGSNLGPGSEIQALVIGAGIHGLSTAYHLVTDAGIKTEDLVVIDKAGGWGGTWYWNRYPGVMCDVEGYSYLPLLEQSGFIPLQR